MGYVVTGKGRNRRVKKQLINHQGGVTLWDVGPHERPSQIKRVALFMSRLEQQGETEDWKYAAAQKIAVKLLGS